MPQPKIGDGQAPPKRKRARRRINTAGSRRKREPITNSHEGFELAYARANRLVRRNVPACEARRLGAVDVSPRDYDCGCDISNRDFLPICEGRKEICRFAKQERWRQRKNDPIEKLECGKKRWTRAVNRFKPLADFFVSGKAQAL